MRQIDNFLKQHPIFNVVVAIGAAAAVYTAPYEISAATGHPITYEDIGTSVGNLAYEHFNPDQQVLGQMTYNADDFRK